MLSHKPLDISLRVRLNDNETSEEPGSGCLRLKKNSGSDPSPSQHKGNGSSSENQPDSPQRRYFDPQPTVMNRGGSRMPMLRLEDLSQHEESGSKLGIRLETCINKDAGMFTV